MNSLINNAVFKAYHENVEVKPGQVVSLIVDNPDFSNAIKLKSGIAQVFLGGNKTGFLKVKKYGNGAQNDKKARWRTSRCPWERMLYDAWKSRGGGKKAAG